MQNEIDLGINFYIFFSNETNLSNAIWIGLVNDKKIIKILNEDNLQEIIEQCPLEQIELLSQDSNESKWIKLNYDILNRFCEAAMSENGIHPLLNKSMYEFQFKNFNSIGKYMTTNQQNIERMIDNLFNSAISQQTESLLDKSYKTLQEQAKKIQYQEEVIKRLLEEKSNRDQYIFVLEGEVKKISDACDSLSQQNDTLQDILDDIEGELGVDCQDNGLECESETAREYREKMQSQKDTVDFQQMVLQKLDELNQKYSTFAEKYNNHLNDYHETQIPKSILKKRT